MSTKYSRQLQSWAKDAAKVKPDSAAEMYSLQLDDLAKTAGLKSP